MPIARSASIHLALVGGLCALGVILFWPSVGQVTNSVIHRHGSSHGVFIPFLSAYFIYLKWGYLKKLPICFSLSGFAALPLLASVPLIAPLPFELQFMAFVIFLVVIALACLGTQICRAIRFPILFLLTMIPIPRDIYALIADMTRHITLNVALGVLSFLHIPFYSQGWSVKLPNALLEVAISCSGIRYLISYLVFGIAYAYLFRSSPLGRVFVIVATIPISLAASSLRLTVIFLATYFISPGMAEYWPHVILSWCVFFSILFSCIGVDQYLLKRKSGIEDVEQYENR